MSTEQKAPFPSSDSQDIAFGPEFSLRVILFHQAVADKLGLNITDHKCLWILLHHGPVTAGKLSEMMGMPTGSMTTVIDRLEKAGFVRREKDPHDRRKVVIQPVPEKAAQEISSLFASFKKAMEELFARYTAEEKAVIRDFIEKSMRIMEEETARLRAHTGI